MSEVQCKFMCKSISYVSGSAETYIWIYSVFSEAWFRNAFFSLKEDYVQFPLHPNESLKHTI